jgi:hypothetical protein
MVIRVELEAVSTSTPAASLETQDVEPDTKLFDSPSVEKHKADQPSSAEVSEAAPAEPRRRE